MNVKVKFYIKTIIWYRSESREQFEGQKCLKDDPFSHTNHPRASQLILIEDHAHLRQTKGKHRPNLIRLATLEKRRYQAPSTSYIHHNTAGARVSNPDESNRVCRDIWLVSRPRDTPVHRALRRRELHTSEGNARLPRHSRGAAFGYVLVAPSTLSFFFLKIIMSRFNESCEGDR